MVMLWQLYSTRVLILLMLKVLSWRRELSSGVTRQAMLDIICRLLSSRSLRLFMQAHALQGILCCVIIIIIRIRVVVLKFKIIIRDNISLSFESQKVVPNPPKPPSHVLSYPSAIKSASPLMCQVPLSDSLSHDIHSWSNMQHRDIASTDHPAE